MQELNRRSLLVASGALLASGGCAHRGSVHSEHLAAYVFLFPLYEFARTAWQAAAPGPSRPIHGFNRFNHRRILSDHTHRAITAPNADTVYSSARLDLSNGGVVIDVPTVRDRYFSLAFMNAMTDHFAYIGTRATAGEGGRFMVVGPAWQGRAPPGVRVLQSETNDVWALARVGVRDQADLAAANVVQDQLVIVSAPEPRIAMPPAGSIEDPEHFLATANAMLGRVAADGAIAHRARDFHALGVAPGRVDAWPMLSEDQKSAWRSAATVAHTIMREGEPMWAETVNGWRYPAPGIGGRRASEIVRACVALSGLAALEDEEATYMRAETDSEELPFDGRNRYRIMLNADAPVDGFWSLSLYRREPDGRLFFHENAIGRFNISDRIIGLVRTADGSIPIAIQSDPASANANWLPAPTGPFSLTFRAYLPRQDLLARRWRLPPIARIERP
jgi:hypothetical protein